MCAISVNVFIIDYRGYGKSQGNPTEEGIYKDAEAAYQYITKIRKIKPNQIIVFGESLGGAVAIDCAAKFHCAGMIIQSSFTNAKDMAKVIMPIFPLWLFIKTKLDNVNKIQKVEVPKLFIHSPIDEIVPYRLGRKLYESAPPPKQFYIVPNAGHNNMDIVGGQKYFDAIGKFIKRVQP
jgi:fermentation-respiration switch protein FrsA (DUF1100 family)